MELVRASLGRNEVPMHGPGGIGAHGTKHRQCTLTIMTKLHRWCLPGFPAKEWPGGNREREKT